MLGFFVGTGLLAALDQWTKRLAVLALRGKEPFVLWEGVFEFYYSENRGAAFGMLQGWQGLFSLVSIAVFVVVAYAVWRLPSTKRYVPLGSCLTLIAAGGAGNMIDRAVQGYVVDFLYFKLIDFPIFNVADCYVTVSTAVLLFLFLRVYTDQELDFLRWRKQSGE